jgi:hypothetical protein
MEFEQFKPSTDKREELGVPKKILSIENNDERMRAIADYLDELNEAQRRRVRRKLSALFGAGLLAASAVYEPENSNDTTSAEPKPGVTPAQIYHSPAPSETVEAPHIQEPPPRINESYSSISNQKEILPLTNEDRQKITELVEKLFDQGGALPKPLLHLSHTFGLESYLDFFDIQKLHPDGAISQHEHGEYYEYSIDGMTLGVTNYFPTEKGIKRMAEIYTDDGKLIARLSLDDDYSGISMSIQSDYGITGTFRPAEVFVSDQSTTYQTTRFIDDTQNNTTVTQSKFFSSEIGNALLDPGNVVYENTNAADFTPQSHLGGTAEKSENGDILASFHYDSPANGADKTLVRFTNVSIIPDNPEKPKSFTVKTANGETTLLAQEDGKPSHYDSNTDPRQYPPPAAIRYLWEKTSETRL